MKQLRITLMSRVETFLGTKIYMSISLSTLYLDILHDVKFLAHDCLVLTEEIRFRHWKRSFPQGRHDFVLNVDL